MKLSFKPADFLFLAISVILIALSLIALSGNGEGTPKAVIKVNFPDFKTILDRTEYDFLRNHDRLGRRIMLLGLSGTQKTGIRTGRRSTAAFSG